jgi:hypothetical protein
MRYSSFFLIFFIGRNLRPKIVEPFLALLQFLEVLDKLLPGHDCLCAVEGLIGICRNPRSKFDKVKVNLVHMLLAAYREIPRGDARRR